MFLFMSHDLKSHWNCYVLMHKADFRRHWIFKKEVIHNVAEDLFIFEGYV